MESEIIPRLMLVHRLMGAPAEARLPPTGDELIAFVRLAADHDLPGALAFVDAICRQGLSRPAVLLGLVAPAARLLGEQGRAELRTFSEVCTGLSTLQQVIAVLERT